MHFPHSAHLTQPPAMHCWKARVESSLCSLAFMVFALQWRRKTVCLSQTSKRAVMTQGGGNMDKVTGRGAHLDTGVQRRLLGGGDTEQRTAPWGVKRKCRPEGTASAQDLKWEHPQCLQVSPWGHCGECAVRTARKDGWKWGQKGGMK